LVYENEDINSTQSNEKTIRGHALYYSTSQVSEILGIADSKVRYYVKEFDSLFDEVDIVISNTQRKYTQKSIDKLKYFIELKKEGMTIRQIKEYCEEVEWDKDKGVVVKESTPLHVQMIATALMEEQNKLMSEFKTEIALENQKQLQMFMQTFVEYQEANNRVILEELKREVSITVQDVVSDKLDGYMSHINSELAVTREINEKIDRLRESMERRKEESVVVKKGIFSGWFKK